MIDFSAVKEITIPEGVVTKIVFAGITLWEAIATGYKNWLPFSTEADGKTLYNNGLGYKSNTRLNSSAAEVTLTGYGVCGYIPVKAGDVVRVKGVTWNSSTATGGYFWAFDSSFTKIKYQRPQPGGITDIIWTDEGNGVVAFQIVSSFTTCKYIRLSAYGLGADTIITVHEEIT